MMKRRHFQQALLGLAAPALTPLGARAQAWPSRNITLVSPYAPGGTTDILARMLGAKLQQRLKQTVVVENKAGAGGNLGTEHVAKAAPDGYTFLLGASGPLVISPSLYAKLGYRTDTDLTPVTGVASAPFVVVANAAAGIGSVKDLLDKARGDTRVAFASAGNGTPQHIIGEMFKVRTGAKLLHVPYRGSGPAMNDLLAGQVQLAFENPVVAWPHIRSGKLVALAQTAKRRSSAYPDIPTLAESGVPGFDAVPWYALMGPARLAADIAARMNKEMRAILDTTEIKARLFAMGAEPLGQSQDELRWFIASELIKWGQVVKASGATVD